MNCKRNMYSDIKGLEHNLCSLYYSKRHQCKSCLRIHGVDCSTSIFLI